MSEIKSKWTGANGKPVVLVSTTYDCPPIPDRGVDWSAVVPEFYDEGEPIGRGPTEDAAILDLLEQYLDDFPKLEGALLNVVEAYLQQAEAERVVRYQRLLNLGDGYADRAQLRGYEAGYRDAVADVVGVFE